MEHVDFKVAIRFAEGLVGVARVNLEGSGSLVPVAFVKPKADKVIILAFPNGTSSDAAKDVMSHTIREHAIKTDAEWVLTIQECWMLTVEKHAAKPAGSIEHVPGRIEAVVAVFETEDGHWMESAEIKTVAGKKTFGPVAFDINRKMDKASGRFTNLLPDKKFK